MPSLNNYLWVLGPEGLGPGANMEVFQNLPEFCNYKDLWVIYSSLL